MMSAEHLSQQGSFTRLIIDSAPQIGPLSRRSRSGKALPSVRFRAKSERLERFSGLLPERKGKNLDLTIALVPYFLDSGCDVDRNLWARHSHALKKALTIYAAKVCGAHTQKLLFLFITL
jgi:hypothetical protein